MPGSFSGNGPGVPKTKALPGVRSFVSPASPFASPISTFIAAASGGATSGGSATVVFIRAVAAAGGATSGGTATASRITAKTATGGATSGGTAARLEIRPVVASGGANAGGSASRTATVARLAAGGATSGGAAANVRLRSSVGAGGATSAGVAAQNATRVVSGAGGAASGGAAAVVFTSAGPQTFTAVGSGGAVSGGSAAVEFSGVSTPVDGVPNVRRRRVIVTRKPKPEPEALPVVEVLDPIEEAIIEPIAPPRTFITASTGGQRHSGGALVAFVRSSEARGIPRKLHISSTVSFSRSASGTGGAHSGGAAGYGWIKLRTPLAIVGKMDATARVNFSGALIVDLTKERQHRLLRPEIVDRYAPELTHIIAAFLRQQARHLASEGRAYLERTEKAAVKARITFDWSSLAGSVQPYIAQAYKDSGTASHKDLVSGPFDQVNDLAAEYAKKRAAELVGKKWVDGQLVDNPNARWAITDTTREKLNELIDAAIEDGMSPSDLAAAIEELIDDPARAEMIARTELATAQTSGAIEGWRASGVVSGKQWITADDPCDICQENADAGVIDIDEDFPSGDDTVPAHPHDECDVIAVLDRADEEEDAA